MYVQLRCLSKHSSLLYVAHQNFVAGGQEVVKVGRYAGGSVLRL